MLQSLQQVHFTLHERTCPEKRTNANKQPNDSCTHESTQGRSWLRIAGWHCLISVFILKCCQPCAMPIVMMAWKGPEMRDEADILSDFCWRMQHLAHGPSLIRQYRVVLLLFVCIFIRWLTARELSLLRTEQGIPSQWTGTRQSNCLLYPRSMVDLQWLSEFVMALTSMQSSGVRRKP